MAKVLATEIRVGNLIEWEKRVWRVLKSYHVHVGGRGGAFMQVEMKDIESGTKTNVRIRTEDKVERAEIDQRAMLQPEGFSRTRWRRMSSSFAFSRRSLTGPVRSRIFWPADRASSAGSDNR